MAKVIITVEDSAEDAYKVTAAFEPVLRMKDGVTLAQEFGNQLMARIASAGDDEDEDDE